MQAFPPPPVQSASRAGSLAASRELLGSMTRFYPVIFQRFLGKSTLPVPCVSGSSEGRSVGAGNRPGFLAHRLGLQCGVELRGGGGATPKDCSWRAGEEAECSEMATGKQTKPGCPRAFWLNRFVVGFLTRAACGFSSWTWDTNSRGFAFDRQAGLWRGWLAWLRKREWDRRGNLYRFGRARIGTC